MIYKRVPQCRVCTNAQGIQVDVALLNRVPYPEIVENCKHLFDPNKPLTKASVYNHWQHMKEAVDAVVAVVTKQAYNTPVALAPNGVAHGPERQVVFEKLVKRRIDEVSVMEHLIESGLDDLKLSMPDNDDPRAVDTLEHKKVRNQIRKATADITANSARVKQIATQIDQDAQQAEKGRLVFRMFEVFRSALESVPDEQRAQVAERLKDALRRDLELKELLATNKGPDNAEEIEAEVMDG